MSTFLGPELGVWSPKFSYSGVESQSPSKTTPHLCIRHSGTITFDSLIVYKVSRHSVILVPGGESFLLHFVRLFTLIFAPINCTAMQSL